MKKLIGGIAIFSLGFVTGGALAWKLACRKYDKLIDEEVESVKRIFSERHRVEPENEAPVIEPQEEDIPDAEDDSIEVQILNPTTSEWKVPKIIDEEDFGTEEFYETDTINLYSDGTITNSRDVPLTMEEVSHYVSQEAIDRLNSDDDLDILHVENENLRIYYEIIKTYIPYEDEDDVV